MATFINETLGMLNPKDFLSTGFQNVARPADPLEGLFTDQTTDNLVAEYYTMQSQYNIPQVAQFHAFDVPAQKSIPAPIDEHNVEKGLIKTKRPTSELLRELIGKGVREESALYDKVMNFAADLADQVVTRTKVARAEVLATGQFTINENDINITVDYGVPEANKSLTLDLGEGADDDILSQMQDIIDMATDAGVTITGMICARSTLTKLRKNKEVQKVINGVNMSGILVSNSQLRAWLTEEFGITQVIVDDMTYSLPYELDAYGRPQVRSQRYFPKGKVTFFGTSNGMKLGAGLWGAPPEEELAGYYDKSGSSSVSPYVYMTQWIETDPAILWTKASALYVPVLFSPNSLYIATIKETPASA